jgi:uncharacterized membrane protein YeiH
MSDASASAARPRVRSQQLVTAADFAGTFVFALEGALAAVVAHLDLFGVMVLGFATALGGGVIRDVLLGALPPSALRGWGYPATAFAAATIGFLIEPHLAGPSHLLITLDAAGLSLFAVAGAAKAFDAGIHPLSCVLLGAVTAVGGGTTRDVLLARIPAILRVDIYATAALLGSLIFVLARRLGLPPTPAAVLGALGCFALRMLSVWQHWQLPGSVAAS